MERTSINTISELVRQKMNLNGPIKNIDEIIRRLGIELEEVEYFPGFAEAKAYFEDGRYHIQILKDTHESRRNFTLAHELGHIFLHIDESNKKEEFYRNLKGEKEYEANEFAAAFLMPKSEFKQKMIENYNDGFYDIGEVARYFNVSMEAAVIRGRWLGLLSWD